MAFKKLGEYHGPIRNVYPGDTITLSVDPVYDPITGVLIQEGCSYSENVTEELVITEAGIFMFENEFGCKKGIGGYFGEK